MPYLCTIHNREVAQVCLTTGRWPSLRATIIQVFMLWKGVTYLKGIAIRVTKITFINTT